MDKPINIEAAKRLVEKYRSIKKEELLEYNVDYPVNALAYITNFGTRRCSLCRSVPYAWHTCEGCIYEFKYHKYMSCCNDETYSKISKAENIDDLIKAINERADYIENLINEISDN